MEYLNSLDAHYKPIEGVLVGRESCQRIRSYSRIIINILTKNTFIAYNGKEFASYGNPAGSAGE
jgi:hypothetical protein